MDLFRARLDGYLGFAADVPRSFIREGSKTAIQRETGEVEQTDMGRASSQIIVGNDEVPNLNIDKAVEKLDAAAREMASQMSRLFFTSIGSAVDKVGNAIDRKGKKLDADAIFEMYDRISLDFNDDGSPVQLSVVLSPNMIELFKETLVKIDSDQDLKRKFESIISKKRMEWRDREANRKLVG